jgi:crossover junction endodeoxyribonuclease RuvC
MTRKKKPKQPDTVKQILALDMGSETGWALHQGSGSIATGVTKFLSTLNPGDRWLRFSAWLGSWHGLDLIVYEEPFIHFKHRSGLGVSYGFKTLVELHAANHNIRCVGIAPTVLKKWSTGHGNATKSQMLVFARSMKWEIENDNEVDARWLLEYTLKRLIRLKETA